MDLFPVYSSWSPSWLLQSLLYTVLVYYRVLWIRVNWEFMFWNSNLKNRKYRGTRNCETNIYCISFILNTGWSHVVMAQCNWLNQPTLFLPSSIHIYLSQTMPAPQVTWSSGPIVSVFRSDRYTCAVIWLNEGVRFTMSSYFIVAWRELHMTVEISGGHD